MVYLDLDELPSLLGRGGLIATNKLAICSFLRSDHLFNPSNTLKHELNDVVQEQTGCVPRGPIRLLTQLRNFGYFMSPLNLFYVFDDTDERVEYVVAEVNNTPWNERHCYVLWDGNRIFHDSELQFAHAKDFHVSPFMSMDGDYHWKLSEPSSDLEVQLDKSRNSRKIFNAGMTLQRRELSRRQLRRTTICYPLLTAQITAGIYYQALKLWWKKCPFYTHPKKLTDSLSPAPPANSLPRATATRTR